MCKVLAVTRTISKFVAFQVILHQFQSFPVYSLRTLIISLSSQKAPSNKQLHNQIRPLCTQTVSLRLKFLYLPPPVLFVTEASYSLSKFVVLNLPLKRSNVVGRRPNFMTRQKAVDSDALRSTDPTDANSWYFDIDGQNFLCATDLEVVPPLLIHSWSSRQSADGFSLRTIFF